MDLKNPAPSIEKKTPEYDLTDYEIIMRLTKELRGSIDQDNVDLLDYDGDIVFD